MAETISINPYDEPTEQTVSLDTGTDSGLSPVEATVAANRASKAQFAFPALNRTYDELSFMIANGEEGRVRHEAAIQADINKSDLKAKYISEIAKQKGSPLTEAEYNHIDMTLRSLSNPTDPTSVFEEYYGKEYLNLVKQTGVANPDSSLYEAIQEQPRLVNKTFNIASDLIAKKDQTMKWLQDIEEARQKQSNLGYAFDVMKSLTPIVGSVEQNLRMRDNVPGVSFLSSLGLGSSLQDQWDALLRMPHEEFLRIGSQIADYFKNTNPTMGLEFFSSGFSQSSNDKFLSNIFPIVDVAGLGLGAAAVKGIRGGIKAIEHLNTSRAIAKEVVKNAQHMEVNKASIMESIGANAEAAVQKVTAEVINRQKGTYDPTEVSREALFSLMKPNLEGLSTQTGKLGPEIANRIREILYSDIVDFLNALENALKVERVPIGAATEKVIRAIKDDASDLYPWAHNTIVDIGKDVKYNRLSNTYDIDLHLANNDGTYFLSREVAETAAEQRGFKEGTFTIDNQGLGYYINVITPLKETDTVIRNLLPELKNLQVPDSMLNAFIGAYRTPEEVLSVIERQNRKVATYGGNLILKSLQESAKAIKELRSWSFIPGTKKYNKWKDFERVINSVSETPNPANGLKPHFADSLSDLDDVYLRLTNRLPDEQEASAYFAMKDLYYKDNVLRTLAEYRNRARVGTQTHTYELKSVEGKTLTSPAFNAVIQKEYPSGNRPMLIVGKDVNDVKLVLTGRNFSGRKDYVDGVKSGKYRLLEMYDPEANELKDFHTLIGRNRVDFVLVENLSSKPLDWKSISSRMGSSLFEKDYAYSIKQARVRTSKYGDDVIKHYEGDATFGVANSFAEANAMAKSLETVRQLLKDNKLQEAMQFAKANIGVEWSKISSWFRWRRKADGTYEAPKFNPDEKIQAVARGKLIGDIDNELKLKLSEEGEFRNGTRYGSLARSNQVKYSGEPDAYDVFAIKNTGTLHNPVYQIEPAKNIDPLISMNRGLSQIVNSTYMDDYKLASVETWLSRAKPYLKATEAQLNRYPLWYFNHPEYLPGANELKIGELRAQHFQIQQFVGMPSKLDSLLHSAAQKMSDAIYNKGGPKMQALDPSWMITKLDDPIRWARSVAFHAKLGLFSIPQLLVQMQTYSTIFALAGARNAGPGASAAFLHQMSRTNANPKIAAWLERQSEKLGWKTGEFKEAKELMERTGFDIVSGEYAIRDNMYANKVIPHGADKFLDAGTFFFTEGERSVRYGAFYTAYKEFRRANPTGRVTDAELRSILNRADDLQVNMSRASSSALHSGVMSLPTQFLTYQLRLSELFLGKRITTKDKMKLLAYNGALYGIPGAVGLTGVPFGDMIRQSAIDNGYVVGDSWIQDATTNGIPSMLLGLATGTSYNIGDRLSAQGFETIKEALRGDTAWWEVMGGAAFSTIANTLSRSDSFTRAMFSAIRGDGEAYPMTMSDVTDIFQEASSISSTLKLITALNIGKFMSKNETYLGDVSKSEAIVNYLTGLTPQGIGDINNVSILNKDRKEAQSQTEKEFIKNFRRALQAGRDGNVEQHRQYMTRAFAWLEFGEYPKQNVGRLIGRALQDYEPLVDKFNYDLLFRNVPAGKESPNVETFKRILQQKER